MAYYSGQGKVYVATRDATGNPGGFRWLGNVPSLELSIETTKFEHKEAYTGNRAIDVTVVTETNASLTFTIEEFTKENLALGLYGTNTAVASDGAVVETLYSAHNPPLQADGTENLVGTVGYPMRLVNPNGVVVASVTDVGAATTYVAGTDYSVDATNGTITPIYNGDETQTSTLGIVHGANLVVTYSHTGHTRTDVFTKTSQEVWLRFEGLSTLDSGETTLIDCYRVAIDPMSGYGLINDEIGSAEITGSILADTNRDAGQQFFQQINITRV